MHTFLRLRTSTAEDAEDLAQQVWCNLCARGYDDLHPGLIWSTARNSLADWYKRQSYRNHAPISTAWAIGQEHDASGFELADMIERTNWTGKERQRAVVELQLQGFTMADISWILGVKENAVKQLKHRALVAIRKDNGV